MKKISQLVVVILIVSNLTACGKREDTSKDTDSSQETEDSLLIDSELDDTIKNSVNAFGYQFFDKLDQDENIFFSPYSITAAFSMLDNAAQNKTKEQIENVFGITDLDILNQQMKFYQEQEQDEKAKLSIANSIWLSTDFNMADTADDYLNRIKYYYNGEEKQVNFESDNAKVLKEINAWVSDKTKGLIDPFTDQIDKETKMALLNAIYFYGEWTIPFEANNTSKQEFKGIQTTSTVDMMHMSHTSFPYVNTNGIKAIQLPYGKGDVVMNIFLPEEKNDLSISKLFSELSTEEKNGLLDTLNQSEGKEMQTIALPKFTMDYSVDNMSELLQEMGISDAFCEHADFSLLAPDLFVSEVSHKAKIEVDEEGSRAAAVTEIALKTTAIAPEQDPLTFIADQPFIFLIQDKKTEVILFMGEVNGL